MNPTAYPREEAIVEGLPWGRQNCCLFSFSSFIFFVALQVPTAPAFKACYRIGACNAAVVLGANRKLCAFQAEIQFSPNRFSRTRPVVGLGD